MKRNWSIEEDNYILDNHGKITWMEMSKFLGCSITTVEKRAMALGVNVEFKTSARWTKEEVDLLREYADRYITKNIAKKLNKSVHAVQKKALKEGIVLHGENDPWKKWMIDYLKDNVNKQSLNQISKFMSMNMYQVRKKCVELGLEYDDKRWTKEEEQTLLKYYKSCHYSELTKVIPNKTKGAILAKARDMNLDIITETSSYNRKHAKFIKENWGKMSINQMALTLGITRTKIYYYKNKFNLPNIGQKKKWTEDKINELRELAKTESISKLAKHFETTLSAISTIASKENISLLDGKKYWTEDKVKKIRELAKDYTLNEITLIMETNNNSLNRFLKKYNIEVSNTSINRRWTEEEVIKLKEMAKNEKNIIEMAKELNRTVSSIQNKIKKEKIEINKNVKYWTKEEEEYLRNEWNEHSNAYLSSVLKRSVSSIVNKAHVLKLREKELHLDALKFEEISEIFNVRRNDVEIIWVILGLPYKTQKISKNYSYKYVLIDDLFAFLENNQFLYDGKDFEENILGVEPEWVKIKRKHDYFYGFDYERSTLAKKKLLQEKKYFLELEKEKISNEKNDNLTLKKCK